MPFSFQASSKLILHTLYVYEVHEQRPHCLTKCMNKAHVQCLSEERVRELAEVTLEQTSHRMDVCVIGDHLSLQIIYTKDRDAEGEIK